MERIESLLLREALARRDIGPEARPTPNCAPMPVLAEMAAGRLRGSADHRKHVYSCDFCLSIIRRIQRERVVPLRLAARIAYPASWAACLAVGLLLGSWLYPATELDSAEVRQGLSEVADALADTRNHAAEQLRGPGQGDSGARVEALRQENSRLKNELRAVVGALEKAHLGLQEVLQQGGGLNNTRSSDTRGPQQESRRQS